MLLKAQGRNLYSLHSLDTFLYIYLFEIGHGLYLVPCSLSLVYMMICMYDEHELLCDLASVLNLMFS